MKAFPDTSFLCALYRQQTNSDSALAFMEARGEPLPISPLLRFEFLHGIRREVFRHQHERGAGLSLSVASGVLQAFDAISAWAVLWLWKSRFPPCCNAPRNSASVTPPPAVIARLTRCMSPRRSRWALASC